MGDKFNNIGMKVRAILLNNLAKYVFKSRSCNYIRLYVCVIIVVAAFLHSFIMVALCNRADHYIFILFLSSFFLLLSSFFFLA